MNPIATALALPLRGLAAATALALAACAGMGGGVETTEVRLDGAQAVPPVSTSAAGSGRFSVSPDRAISGGITVSGISATAAHIHEGAPGKGGPVAVPLARSGDNGFSVPADTRLTEAQYAAYRAGNLYVNVHSAAHPDGEIRGQLKPPAPPPVPATRSYGY